MTMHAVDRAMEMLATILIRHYISFAQHMTQCKIRVNLGIREPCKGEITILHREPKNKKDKKIRCWKFNLKTTDFFQNAKFVSGLPNGYLPLEKKVFFACHIFQQF